MGRGGGKALCPHQRQQQPGQVAIHLGAVVVEHGRQKEVHAQPVGQMAAGSQTVAEGVHQPHHGVGKSHASQRGAFRQLQPQLFVLRVVDDLRQGAGDLLHCHQGQRIAHRVLGCTDKGLDGVGHGVHGGGGGDIEGQPLGQARV